MTHGSETQEPIEAVGDQFSVEALLDVRRRTRQAAWEIGNRVRSGMTEEEAKEIAASVLGEAGLRKGWHKILVRCGANTTKNFEEPSTPGVVLDDEDLFFVDIGPLFDGTEGDAGETFVLGSDPEMLKAKHDVQELWRLVRTKWRDDGSSGTQLYDYADATARSMGWVLNLDLTGHRLSDFPHDAHYDGVLSDVGFRPSSGMWVLEIQIRHPELEMGAFFEDLLLADDALQRFSYGPPI